MRRRIGDVPIWLPSVRCQSIRSPAEERASGWRTRCRMWNRGQFSACPAEFRTAAPCCPQDRRIATCPRSRDTNRCCSPRHDTLESDAGIDHPKIYCYLYSISWTYFESVLAFARIANKVARSSTSSSVQTRTLVAGVERFDLHWSCHIVEGFGFSRNSHDRNNALECIGVVFCGRFDRRIVLRSVPRRTASDVDGRVLSSWDGRGQVRSDCRSSIVDLDGCWNRIEIKSRKILLSRIPVVSLFMISMMFISSGMSLSTEYRVSEIS